MKPCASHKGSALITCMIFLMVFAAMAVGMASMSGANLQMADNQQEANQAFATAESGLEVVRYWLSRVRIPSSTPVAQYLSTTITSMRNDLLANGVSNVTLSNDGVISPVTVCAATGQNFMAQISIDPDDPAVVQVRVLGRSRRAARTVKVDYRIKPYKFPIFDYGIATKGALQFPQNPTLTGTTENWEADIYVESAGSLLAVQVLGNANFDGDINIGNPLATVSFGGDVQIGGDHGQAAIDNHITFGAEPVEFPIPETTRFQTYATGPVVNSTTSLSSSMTLANGLIQAGTNPTFLGNVTIEGILLIQSPNVVTFTKNVTLNGLIVADGSTLDTTTHQINFTGNFSSGGYPSGSQFDAIRQEVGSSILAPSFGVSFTGNFSSVNGVMAAGSLYFSRNASATVKGTMISYSQDPMLVDGNISMSFDRTGMVEIPAGFDLLSVLTYEPASYTLVF